MMPFIGERNKTLSIEDGAEVVASFIEYFNLNLLAVSSRTPKRLFPGVGRLVSGLAGGSLLPPRRFNSHTYLLSPVAVIL